MTIQHLGEDFTTSVRLNLLPGIKLPRGIYQMNVQYFTNISGNITVHHMSQNMLSGKSEDLTAIIGRDVRDINVQIFCHNSFPTNPLINYQFYMRIDRLILMNLATKLLNLP